MSQPPRSIHWSRVRQLSRALQAELTELPAATTLPLDLPEWSFMWVNVKRADAARGSFIGGQQIPQPDRVEDPAGTFTPDGTNLNSVT